MKNLVVIFCPALMLTMQHRQPLLQALRDIVFPDILLIVFGSIGEETGTEKASIQPLYKVLTMFMRNAD